VEDSGVVEVGEVGHVVAVVELWGVHGLELIGGECDL